MNIQTHLQNVINYYEQEVRKIEKMDSPSENDKSWVAVTKMILKSLKSNEKKLLKTKI